MAMQMKISKAKMQQVRRLLLLLLLLLLSLSLKICTATDTITSTQFIRHPEAVISEGGVFKLGFFSPENSTVGYVGIWYNRISVFTVVWIANRDKPLRNSSSGILAFSQDGNLVVLDEQKEIVWSSNITSSSNNSAAQLLDSGNLVLRDSNRGGIMWESFRQVMDKLLPNMKLTTSTRAGENQVVTSWKSSSNPSKGNFSLGLKPSNLPELFMWKGNRPLWRSGPWNGQTFVGISSMYSTLLDGYRVVDDREGTVYFTYAFSNESLLTAFVLDSEGVLAQNFWVDGSEKWITTWVAVETECDVYGKCGPFGSCNSKDSPICSCLKGFKPKNLDEWRRGNWTSGCVRMAQLQCNENSSNSAMAKEDGFLYLRTMKLPDFAQWSPTPESACRDQCLRNCSCTAYAVPTGIGCLTWSESLIDMQKLPSSGVDLYIRMAHSELDKEKNRRVITAITVSIGVVLFIVISACTYFLRKHIAKKRERKRGTVTLLLSREENLHGSKETMFGNKNTPEKARVPDFPLFTFERLATATDNFDGSNKLGQGGFGPVYKGKLQNGQEIAVKRLSRASGQGIEEFMNEVVVISRLQHRNLVRLLGCCVEGEEKMLIYEYMPNKSLDAFLFDIKREKALDWRTRLNIIHGICRGLLYLHRDSRLRIIHRDLKAGNILLDEELNPKISDFGMARIFGGNQDQAKTKRVVGTYGYMSPEYAMEGRFSEKSDVFSFGILLLEIVSGRKNTSFYHDVECPSLLRFAWKLWNEDNIIALIDSTLSDQCFRLEILRCIHVGLLCVQESANDRPTISTVISMVNSEITDLPLPKQPAFAARCTSTGRESFRKHLESCSENNVTVTLVEGR